MPTACRVSPASALHCSPIDQAIGGAAATYLAQVVTLAQQLAPSPDYPLRPSAEVRQLTAAQKREPLAACHATELAIMSRTSPAPASATPAAADLRLQAQAGANTTHLTRRPAHPQPSRAGLSQAQQTIGALAG